MKTYKITYSNGNTATLDTLDEAKAAILERNPEAHIEDFSDRSLAWNSEDDAGGDDGQRAFAEIRKMSTAEQYPSAATEQWMILRDGRRVELYEQRAGRWVLSEESISLDEARDYGFCRPSLLRVFDGIE